MTGFPQTCLRNDRWSTLELHGRPEGEAMAAELEVGLRSLASDALSGAARFAGGRGRHGSFED